MNQMIRINNTISSCCIQAFSGIVFLLAIVGMCTALCFGGFQDCMTGMQNLEKGLLENGFHYQLFQKALVSDAVCLALPILCAFPFTASFLDDMESGFIKAYLHRSGRGHYIAGKVIACGLSGGLVPIAGTGLYYGVLLLIFLPMEKAAAFGAVQENHAPDVLNACVLFFCAGMLFSLIGMLCSVVTASKYMAYASPFVFYYVLIILHDRYLKDIYILNPREWISPTDTLWVWGIWGSVLWMAELIFLVTVVLSILMYRRIEEI